eukprot:3646200-Pyramimonas_sp.AAC.1
MASALAIPALAEPLPPSPPVPGKCTEPLKCTRLHVGQVLDDKLKAEKAAQRKAERKAKNKVRLRTLRGSHEGASRPLVRHLFGCGRGPESGPCRAVPSFNTAVRHTEWAS